MSRSTSIKTYKCVSVKAKLQALELLYESLTQCDPGCKRHIPLHAHRHSLTPTRTRTRMYARTALCHHRSHSSTFSWETGIMKHVLLTCQRISTEVVVCGVTERILGASSGAGEDKQSVEEEEEREEEWAKLS